MNNRFDLSGKTALVTGASSGLGLHFAKTLASAGAAVVLAARRGDRLAQAVDEINANGGQAHAVTMDVTDNQSIIDGVAAGEAALGPMHILINNAGTSVPKPLLDMSEQDWDNVVGPNLKGAVFVAQAMARQMVKNQIGGSIVNIASILSFRVSKAATAYVASKAGIKNVTQVMALELAKDRIRVNAIAPGYFSTDLNSAFLESDLGKDMVTRIPMRRTGAYEELDGVLLLLSSDAGRYMTGAIIPVDGGHLCGGL